MVFGPPHCNVGVCNETLDQCEASPANEGISCDDGDVCTVGETWIAGSPMLPPNCGLRVGHQFEYDRALMAKPLNESVLYRLTSEALVSLRRSGARARHIKPSAALLLPS